MQVVDSVARLHDALKKLRVENGGIGLVPTMGSIHKGHLSLLEIAGAHARTKVVSIFVNPTQFDRADDFSAYPRTLDSDIEQLESAGADVLFFPSAEEMYPNGSDQPLAVVEATIAGQGLEGAHRPGHFKGVATVVAKLLNLVRPSAAVFGQKDFQQLAVIRAMVDELFIPTRIVAAATLRDDDGLAMSSRNQQLSPDERAIAPRLYQRLSAVGGQLAGGAKDFAAIEMECAEALKHDGFTVDYVAVRGSDMQSPGADQELIVLCAAWLGPTRLIDNIIVGPSD